MALFCPSVAGTSDQVAPTRTMTSSGETSIETSPIEEDVSISPNGQESNASGGLSLMNVDEVIILPQPDEEDGRPPESPLGETEINEDSEYTGPRRYPRSCIGNEVHDSDPTYHRRLEKPVPPRKALPDLVENSDGESEVSSLGPDCPMDPPYDGEPNSSDEESEEGPLDNLVALLTREWSTPSDDGSDEDDQPLLAGSANSAACTSDPIRATGGSLSVFSIDNEEHNPPAGPSISLKRKHSADDLDGSSNP
jgi:hypothetical protein